MSLFPPLAAVGLLLACAPLSAVAGSFSANATAVLRLLSPQGPVTDLQITQTPATSALPSGGATAAADVTLGDPTVSPFSDSLATSVAGDGDAAAGAEAALSVMLENSGGSDLALLFELEYLLQAAVGGRGDAYVDALIDLFVDGVLLSGPNSLFDAVLADNLTGPFTGASDARVRFEVSLLPGEAALIDLVLSQYGESQVPAPAPLALLTAGLLALGFRRAQPRHR